MDEAQNSTPEQMKMILTRQGFNSKMVVTGDPTQIDLQGQRSGLVEVIDVLRGIEGISFVPFDDRDVVRHSLVQKIVRAYESYNEKIGANRQMSLKLRDRRPAERPPEGDPPVEAPPRTEPPAPEPGPMNPPPPEPGTPGAVTETPAA
jgi:phosphate starvation-inducible PhoH-like protein